MLAWVLVCRDLLIPVSVSLSVSRSRASVSRSRVSASRSRASVCRSRASVSRSRASASRSRASASMSRASASRSGASASRGRVAQWYHWYYWFRLTSKGPSCSSTSDIRGFQLLHTFSNPHPFLRVCFGCFHRHPRGCEMVSHCVLISIFPVMNMLDTFACAGWPVCIFIVQKCIQVLCSCFSCIIHYFAVHS